MDWSDSVQFNGGGGADWPSGCGVPVLQADFLTAGGTLNWGHGAAAMLRRS